MKLPIDEMCAKSGVLCPKCQRLVREKKVSQLEVELSKLIANTVAKNKKYRNLELYKVLRLRNAAILLIKPGQKELYTDPNVSLINVISDKLGTDIILLEKTKDTKKLVETIIAPATPISITKVYIPPFGEEEYVIKVPKEQKDLVRFSNEEIAEIIKTLLGASAYLSFE